MEDFTYSPEEAEDFGHIGGEDSFLDTYWESMYE